MAICPSQTRRDDLKGVEVMDEVSLRNALHIENGANH